MATTGEGLPVESIRWSGKADGDSRRPSSAPGVSAPYRLSEALEFLRRINGLRLEDGSPIYDARLYEGVSLWSFWQTYLYETCLKSYTRHLPFLRGRHSREAPVSPDFARLLNPPVLSQSSPRNRLALRAAESATRVVWKAYNRARGARVLVYTPDIRPEGKHACDFRFHSIYEFLSTGGIRFAELFHTLGIRSSIRNSWKRKRIPYYIEFWQDPAMPAPRRTPPLDPAEWAAKDVLEGHIAYFLDCCRVSVTRVDGLRKALRDSGIRALVAMDDLRSINELILACKLEGIKTILVQHGLITRFHVGWTHYGIPGERLLAPDHFLVRAPFWKSVLESSGSHLTGITQIVSGLDAAGSDPEESPRKPLSGGPINVMLLLETLWDPAEARPFVRKLLADNRIRLHFKTRPDIAEDAQIRDYFGESRPHSVVKDLNAARSEMDVVLGSHSSLMYKLLEWRKPVFRMVTSFEFGEQLSRFGLAGDLRLEDDFHALFADACGRQGAEADERWLRFNGGGNHPDFQETLTGLLEEYL